MNASHSFEARIGNLLRFGTWTITAIIALGVLLQIAGIAATDFDLVTIGIVGFIALPILRLLTMLVSYVRPQDRGMIRVVSIVLCFVFAGLVAGLIW